MRKVLDYFLNKHSIQKSVDLVEDVIKRGYDENLVIHHKQDLSFLYSIRINKIEDDNTALLNFIASKELSRSFRTVEKFCESGNQEGVELINDDINFLNYFLYGAVRFTDNTGLKIDTEHAKSHPERTLGELGRMENGYPNNRNHKSIQQIQHF